MNHWNSQRYLASGRSQKRAANVLANAASTAELIRKAAPGAAILFTLNHLARETGVPYHYLGYGSYLSDWRRRTALKMWTGWPTFPMVFVDGVLIGGARELIGLLGNGELERTLAAGRPA